MASTIEALEARARAAEENMEQLAALVDAADDSAAGVCAALNELLQVLSDHVPAVIRDLEPRLRHRRRLYERADRGEDVGYSADLLHPMSLLYGLLDKGGAFERAGC